MDTDDENRVEYALGFAVVRRWGDLSAIGRIFP
jgi:hypothetical protein